MLTITTTQLTQLDEPMWIGWVDWHVTTLRDLLPDIACLYAEQIFRALIEGLLRCADLYGMVQQDETLAFCYGSLTLGVGFEADPRFDWAAAAMAETGSARAMLLWDGISCDVGGGI